MEFQFQVCQTVFFMREVTHVSGMVDFVFVIKVFWTVNDQGGCCLLKFLHCLVHFKDLAYLQAPDYRTFSSMFSCVKRAAGSATFVLPNVLFKVEH